MDEYHIDQDVLSEVIDEATDYFKFDYLNGVYPRARVPFNQIKDWFKTRAEATKDKQKK